MKPVFPTLLVSALLMGAGFAATAQTTPPPAAPADHPAMHQMGHGGHMDRARMEAMHAKHLAELKAKLKITASQEGAWTTFTDAMKPPAHTMQRPDHAAMRAEMDKLTTPERIDKMREMHAKHQADRQAAMDQRGQAVKTFYASLSDEQKKVFDAEHARMAKQMEHMREGHHKDGKKAPAPSTAPAAKS